MSRIIDDQISFYKSRFEKYGDDPKSLSYNSVTSQNLRFKILSELFKFEVSDGFSVHEVGCGLAHMRGYLLERGVGCEYSGSDICHEFIKSNRKKYPECDFWLQDMSLNLCDICSDAKGKDYYVQSGAFNPIGRTNKEDWERFVFSIISNMFQMCSKGIAFNFLTLYSDEECRSGDLYYADPCFVFDWCKRNLSRFVTLIEDSPFYEFTILVFREDFVRSLYPEEFAKYFRRRNIP
jgi:hypothetical protein